MVYPIERDPVLQLERELLRSPESVWKKENCPPDYRPYLSEETPFTRALLKVLKVVRFLLDLISQTGAGWRFVKKETMTVYDLKFDEKLMRFNIAPPLSSSKFRLGEHQREALFGLFKESEGVEREQLKSLVAKHKSNTYRFMNFLSEQGSELRRSLHRVNLLAIQAYFKEILPFLNNQILNKKNEPVDFIYPYRQALIAEILAKSLAYNTVINQAEIAIPVAINENKDRFKLVTYRIEKDYLGDGLPFYILKPHSSGKEEFSKEDKESYASQKEIDTYAQPWIIVRGTSLTKFKGEEGVDESIAADFKDENGVSALPVWQRRDTLAIKLKNLYEETGRKGIQLTGHSLGGVLVQSIHVIFSSFVKQTFAFNSPGVDRKIEELYQTLPLEKKKNLFVFHQQGDFLSGISPEKIGVHVGVESNHLKKKTALRKHSALMLNGPSVQGEVDLKEDKRNKMRRLSEFVRCHVLSKVVQLKFHRRQAGWTWYQERKELRFFIDRYIARIKCEKTFHKNVV